jgi:hypothetical protein
MAIALHANAVCLDSQAEIFVYGVVFQSVLHVPFDVGHAVFNIGDVVDIERSEKVGQDFAVCVVFQVVLIAHSGRAVVFDVEEDVLGVDLIAALEVNVVVDFVEAVLDFSVVVGFNVLEVGAEGFAVCFVAQLVEFACACETVVFNAQYCVSYVLLACTHVIDVHFDFVYV